MVDTEHRVKANKAAPKRQPKLMVCVNAIAGPRKQCCGGRGAEALAEALEAGIAQRSIAAEVKRVVCLNQCHRGPSMRIAPGGRFYFQVADADLPAILDELEALAGTRGETDTEPLIFPGA